MNRKFLERYVFKGTLTLKTGLHIGGGRATLSPTDSPVIRTPDGKPFIPGSSFKGAFRSTVEKLAPMVNGVRSCGMDDQAACIGPQGEKQKRFNEQRSTNDWGDAELLAKLEEELCDTCKLFGSPYAASRVNFSDLYTQEETEGLVQIRDGVAIDRDSEKAVDNLLYNYEVVAPSLTFNLEIMLEDPTDTDLGLTCLGLSEFMSGFGSLGGKRSRGLGQCLVEGLQIYHLNLADSKTRAAKLLKYLTGQSLEAKMDTITDVSSFINRQIEGLLNREASHA
ncbi:MAG: CRISPR-associated RAMP protein [Anaerolineae bacterium]|nr:CRISPR-associated RAMP protein [Anaerolineae bacterium]